MRTSRINFSFSNL